MRKPVIAGNWKMNTTLSEGVDLIQGIKSSANTEAADVIICPPFTHLETAKSLLNNTGIHLGAQNMSEQESGAFTGEISASMLKPIVSYVILGHSERRTIYNETDSTINAKIKQALAHNLNPIFCIGETLEHRESGNTLAIIESQLKNGLANISEEDLSSHDVIIAYEPVWAIGTGKVATPEQAQEVHTFIRKTLSDIYSDAFSQKTRLQYGGSVKPENAQELLSQEDIDGALVGGACLKAESFIGIIDAA